MYVYVYKIWVEDEKMLRKSYVYGMLCDSLHISVQAQQCKKQVPILTHDVTILPRLIIPKTLNILATCIGHKLRTSFSLQTFVRNICHQDKYLERYARDAQNVYVSTNFSYTYQQTKIPWP
jgi:hypothetical protein